MSPADPLRRELDELFEGALAPLQGKLVLDPGDRWTLPAAELIRPPVLREVLHRFGTGYAGGDSRAVASLWSQWYFGALVPPTVAAGVLASRRLPVALGDVAVILDEETARPAGFRLPTKGGTGGRDVLPRLEVLVHDHLAPFVEAFATEAGLGEGALWCNAGRPLQWILDAIEDRRGDRGPSRASVSDVKEALLYAERWDDGRPNPLAGTVRYVEDAGERVARRRICCLRYLLPGVAGCGSLCPLPDVREEGSGPG